MRDGVRFGVLWIILSALTEWLVYFLGNHFYYTTGSVQAVDGQNAAAFIFYTVAPIFVFVVLMLFFGIFQFRRRKSEDGSRSPFQFRTNKVFVTVWITVSLVVNLILFLHPTASAEQAYFNQAAATNQASSNALIVDVDARQWEWRFDYPQYGLTQTVDKSGNDQLVLPVNRPVKFVIRSFSFNHNYDSPVDVIHSFWIPAFGIKMDAVPGETRYEYVTPTQISSTAKNAMYRVQCAEVCGPGHPYMFADMKVVSKSDFQKWVKSQQSNS